ncbi:PREDICTED: uncharacterized protein LOC109586179 isoform X1 [Amphimedon queenslandica]|uniref:Death domain-containing protein n=1 Tax=Amphimedon queenslandica TaxID=400682 RepID=A0AAN0JMB1_AMPQE|nr:PREDICTED: uncharacterized protein LOC109586179 isoform X1 [Amphimedon queenslandica]|eukprot:XP_019857908.1 PREDICTED: uncharacterized protein LOC109586179 isoform X1 [Amphimedon queenslandica]
MENSFCCFLSCSPTTKELTEHVDVGTNWFILGTMLDLDQKRLRGIEAQAGHTDTHKMIEMFNLWLTTTPTASRKEVLDVLRKRVVGENKIADQYEKYLKELHNTNYTPPSTEAVSIFQRNIQSLNEALVSPVQVSQLLFCKRCISEATLDEMERIDQRRSLDDKKTTLLTAMQETVSSNYRKLKDIATVLSDVEQTRDIADNIMTEFKEKIPQEDVSTVVQPQEGVGGNEDRASDILRNNYSALSQSITEPVRVAKLLHEEVISDEALSCVMSTRGSVSDSRAVLLKAVRDAVHSNYKHLELFVIVLRKFSETAHIGDTIFQEYKHHFSNDENIEEMETYLTEKRGSQYISSDSDSEGSAILGHWVPFPHKMRKEFKEMRIKFGSTFYRVRLLFSKKWAKSQKDINKVKTLLADTYPDLKSELSVAKTIDSVLDVVKRKCSIVDVHLLEVIAVHFKVKEAIKIIIKHKEAAKEFCESVSVSLSSNETLQAIPMQHLPCETVTFVLSWDADDTTLQDVYDVLLELGPLPNYHIKVTDVCKGRSVVVTCYCPAEYTTLLIMAVLGKIEILQEKGLKEFKVGNCTIWNKVLPVMTTETPKKTDKLTKETVNNYEDMERELLSMRQQLAKKEKQVQELIKERDQPDDTDELKRSLVKKNQEIDHLKVSIKKKDDESVSKIRELQTTCQYATESSKTQGISEFVIGKTEVTLECVAELQVQKRKNKALMLENEKLISEIKKKERIPEQIESGSKVQYITESSSSKRHNMEARDEVFLKCLTFKTLKSFVPSLLTNESVKCLNIQSTPLKEFAHYFFMLMTDNSTLKHLLLTHDTINDDGVKSLAHSLKANVTLTLLSLDFNSEVTSESCKSLADLLRANKTLRVLSLSHTNIDVDGAHLLVESLEPNDPLKSNDSPKPDDPPKPNDTLEWLVLDERHRESFPGVNRMKF